MALEWMPREDGQKDHALHTDGTLGSGCGCPLRRLRKTPVDRSQGQCRGWALCRLDSFEQSQQYNSYTTEMVKGVIAGFENASLDRSVVSVVFTATGPFAFCTGGNTKEYSEYYSRRPR